MTSPRASQALEFRKAGVAYSVIAERLGYGSEDAARAAVGAELADHLADDGREATVLEVLQLDGMITGLYAKARGGDIRAIDTTLRLMERRRLLMESE